MNASFRVAAVLLAALHGVGCGAGMYAPQTVTWYLTNRDGIWLRVERADFAATPLKSSSPSNDGSNLLQAAAHLRPSVARIVDDYGVPDALRVRWTGNSASVESASLFELAYLERGEIVYFDPGRHRFRTVLRPIPHPAADVARMSREALPLRLVELHGPLEAPYGRRAMHANERAGIDPDLALRVAIEDWARVLRIGREVVMQLSDEDIGESLGTMEPGYTNNFMTTTVNASSARLFGEEPGQPGRYIAWVDPASPVAQDLEVGWRLVAIEGQPPERYEAVDAGDPVEFTLQRDGKTRSVTVTPERWPIDIYFVVMAASNRSAFAAKGEGGAYVGIASPFLDVLATDDMLAVTLGHEVAHIALGHLTPPSTSEKALRLGWMLTAGIVSPPLATGVLNRFGRGKERSADLLGLRLAHRAGYNADAGVALMDAFEESHSVDVVTQFLALHPPYDERRRILGEEAERLRAGAALGAAAHAAESD